VVNDELEHALQSRVTIEQAKGVLAERAGIDVEQAFTYLRSFARNHGRRLVDVAHQVIDGTLATADVIPPGGGP
jgi:AmiR/NasT family two-component response regulator